MHSRGTEQRLEPLSYARSFSRVSNEFRMLEFACAATSGAFPALPADRCRTLKISSTNATSASGK